MINPEDVVHAYRLILGREPENADIVNRYAAQVSSVSALRDLFIGSGEFRAQFDQVHAPKRFRRGFHGPAMTVELEASPDQLVALHEKTAAQWKFLGETEPYWSVITHENYLVDTFDQGREAFYASGEAEASMLDLALKRHGIDLHTECRCLELGCGVGRVTAALARRYREVIGVDISAPHLTLARNELQSQGISNVQYEHLSTLDQVNTFGPIDLFYSKIVLQHNTPPVISILLKNLLGSLNSGGVGLFQIPVYKTGYKFLIEPYLREQNETNMEMHFYPQAQLFQLIEEANCRVCEVYEDDAIGAAASMLSNTFLVQKR